MIENQTSKRVVFDNCQFALTAPACGACDGLPTLIPNTPASYDGLPTLIPNTPASYDGLPTLIPNTPSVLCLSRRERGTLRARSEAEPLVSPVGRDGPA